MIPTPGGDHCVFEGPRGGGGGGLGWGGGWVGGGEVIKKL